MLSCYTLLLEQSDIVSFKGLFNHVIMIGKFLLIIHIKTNNECFYQLYTSVAFSLACGELNSFTHFVKVTLEMSCTMGPKRG